MPDCPHCSKEITTLSGFIKQADHEERLKGLRGGKDTEIKALSDEVLGLRGKVTGYDAIVAERDTLKTAATAREERDARSGLFTAEGAKVDPAMLPHFEMIYNASQAGVAEAEAQTFEAWFAAGAREHVLLKPHFGQGAAVVPPVVVPPVVDPAGGSGINTLGGIAPAVVPPGPGGRLTPQDVDNYSRSAEYKALSRDDQRTKIAELRAQTDAQNRGAQA